MNYLAAFSVFIWIPVVLLIFASRPARRGVVVSFIFAWLFLPSVSWKFSGIPDYTKMSATVAGVLLGVAIFDLPRLLAFRPRRFDLPVLIFCLCPMVPAATVGMGTYEGLSAILDQLQFWGVPYLLGRLYFDDLEGLRELALGIVIGGLLYVPLCLIEIRFSPQLTRWVYGMYNWEGERYGGYRPKVFLGSGLELGMWMTCCSLLAYQAWAGKTVRKLAGYDFGRLLAVLLATTILCKSTGALMLLFAGMAALWMVGRTRKAWPVWILIAAAPLYTGSRIAGLWSGRELLEVSSFLGEDRTQSLRFRLENEDMLIDHSMKNALFGGGRKDGALVVDSSGRMITICDGYWIIMLGQNGLVGLGSLLAMLLMPAALLARRHPPSTWNRPEVAPAAGLATVLTLIMIDDLSNGMMNPIYGLIVGGVTGLGATRKKAGHLAEAESGLAAARELEGEGQAADAELSYRRAIELIPADEGDPAGLRVRAGALEGLGSALLAGGRPAEAEAALREAVLAREVLASAPPDDACLPELAAALGRLGRALAELGRGAEAIEARRRALDLWVEQAARHPDDPEARDGRADALNDLAWLLAAGDDPALLDPAGAVRLAEEATRLVPGHAAPWNTLGVARYRSGDWPGAIEALGRSVDAGPPGGTAFDHYFLAMAWGRLGDGAKALEHFDRAVDRADRVRPGHPLLARFRDEATAVLGSGGASGAARA